MPTTLSAYTCRVCGVFVLASVDHVCDAPFTPPPTNDTALPRALITNLIATLRAGRKSRERSIAITKLQEAGYWLMQDMQNEE